MRRSNSGSQPPGGYSLEIPPAADEDRSDVHSAFSAAMATRFRPRPSSGVLPPRALNRVAPKPPVIRHDLAKMLGWRGPVADDDAPPVEAFPRLVPQRALPAEWVVRNLGHSKPQHESLNRWQTTKTQITIS